MSATPLIYRLKNDFQELSCLMDAVEQFGRIHQLDNQTIYSLNRAVEELITNLILHGKKAERAQEIEVRLLIEDHELILEISDDAPPFNPLHVSAPSLAMAGGDTADGTDSPANLGVFLVRQTMDEMEYQPQPHGNLLILRKKLPDRIRVAAC